jgi:RNA polymerase sigma-70 factor, ECF subfamily
MRMNTQMKIKPGTLDQEYLVDLYEQYNPKIFRYAYRQLGDQDAAEECVAETFHRFLGSLRGNPKGPENVQAFIYRIAHNWITDYYRRRKPIEPLDENIHDRRNGNPMTELSEKLEQERVRNALLRLPDEQRQVIVLRFLEEQSHEQVAQVIQKTTQATRALQYRALNNLKRLLLEPEEV